MNFAGNLFTTAYHTLNEVMRTDLGLPIDISRDQFKHGYSLFCFDLSQDGSPNALHFNAINTGSLEVKAKFETGLVNPIKLIAYLEYDAVLSLDAARHWFLDYNI